MKLLRLKIRENEGFTITWVVLLLTILMLLLSGVSTMVVSGFRFNNAQWQEEQAYLVAKSAVDLVADEFTVGTVEAEELYTFYVLQNCNKMEVNDFDADLTQEFNTKIQIALLSPSRMAIFAAAESDKASKGVVVYLHSDRVITEIDYINNIITYLDDSIPPFIVQGYEVVDIVKGNEINIDEIVTVPSMEDFYDDIEEEEKVGNITGRFYIRYDGKIPYEPSSYSTELYTSVIEINRALIEGRAISNDFTELYNNIAIEPTSNQIRRVYPSYNSSTDYILWYVQKWESDGWHIDGVLLNRSQKMVTYNPNWDEWNLSANGSVPSGGQVETGETFEIDFAASQRLHREGYYLAGWTRSDTNEVIPINGSFIMPDVDVVLYAKWRPNWTLVQFMMNDNTLTVYDTQEVSMGDLVIEPEPPQRDEIYTLRDGSSGRYWTFIGWFTSAKGATPWNFEEDMPERHMNLYAHWEVAKPDIKRVDYMMNSGDFTSVYVRQYIIKDETAYLPEDPVRLGYVFDGWFTTPYGSELWDFDTEITADTKIYAHWTEAWKVRYAIDFLPSSIPNDYKLKNEIVTVSSIIPTYTDKYFAGWKMDYNDMVYYGDDIFVMPDQSVTLNARWADEPVTFKLKYEPNFPELITSSGGNTTSNSVNGYNKLFVKTNGYNCEYIELHEPEFDTVSNISSYISSIDGYLNMEADTEPEIETAVEIRSTTYTSSYKRIDSGTTYSFDEHGNVERATITITLYRPNKTYTGYGNDRQYVYYRYSIEDIEDAINNEIDGTYTYRTGVSEYDLIGYKHGAYWYGDIYIDDSATLVELSRNMGSFSCTLEYNDISTELDIIHNYTFLGWNTSADGSGTAYVPGQTWRSSSIDGETLTLYAQWNELDLD